MTSNLGSQQILEMSNSEADKTAIKEMIEELLFTQFKPEFLNRIDETIIFNRLNQANLLEIVDIQLNIQLGGAVGKAEVGPVAVPVFSTVVGYGGESVEPAVVIPPAGAGVGVSSAVIP